MTAVISCDSSVDVISADTQGLPLVIRDMCKLSKGLVVVTGPTGIEKSTTLVGMIDLISDTRACHVITIEGPFKLAHKAKKCLLTQREVHTHQPFPRTAPRSGYHPGGRDE